MYRKWVINMMKHFMPKNEMMTTKVTPYYVVCGIDMIPIVLDSSPPYSQLPPKREGLGS